MKDINRSHQRTCREVLSNLIHSFIRLFYQFLGFFFHVNNRYAGNIGIATKEKLLKESTKQEAYYNTFLNIDRDEKVNREKANKYTHGILNKLPSGNVNDKNTACHVLNNLYKTKNDNCLFFNSNDGVDLHDTFQNIVDKEFNNLPIILKLSSSEGLDGTTYIRSPNEKLTHIHQLKTALQKHQTHDVLNEIVKRLAKVHQVNNDNIVIQKIFAGSVNIAYTVTQQLKTEKPLILKLKTTDYQKEFKNVISVKIHPLLDRPTFDISMFDKRGDKIFGDDSNTFHVGPPKNKQLYTQPKGWERYGLNVLGKYDNGKDDWLHPFQNHRNWYRAFHGTKNASSDDFKQSDIEFDKKFAAVDAMANIHRTGFRPARTHLYGNGVYCSPNSTFLEPHYVGEVEINTEKGLKKYRFMLMVAVNPDGVTYTKNENIWVVPEPENIRPYGILIKQV